MPMSREFIEARCGPDIDSLKTSQEDRDLFAIQFLLPEGTVLHDMQWRAETNMCLWLVEHPDFPETAEGVMLPRVHAEYKKAGADVVFVGWRFYEEPHARSIQETIDEINKEFACPSN